MNRKFPVVTYIYLYIQMITTHAFKSCEWCKSEKILQKPATKKSVSFPHHSPLCNYGGVKQ